ncbi:MAG: hypothetical protein ACKO6N_27985 [Myxococcota bacterium]
MRPPSLRSTRSRSLEMPGVSLALLLFLSLGVGCSPEEEQDEDVTPSVTPSEAAQKAIQERPPAPVEPPNPAVHRPPTDNPGGLNRFRPARPIPGLEGSER